MTEEPRTETNTATSDDAGARKNLRSPLLRLAFGLLFVFTLPFTWGETSSCNGPTKVYTGYEQVTSTPSNALAFATLIGMPVLLGFVQYALRHGWMRLLADVIAGMFASFATFSCFIATIFSGGFLHKTGRVYPAPYIATLAMFLMTLHAFRGAVQRLTEIFAMRRKVNRPK